MSARRLASPFHVPPAAGGIGPPGFLAPLIVHAKKLGAGVHVFFTTNQGDTMPYIVHYDDDNPNIITECIVLLDDKPTTEEMERDMPPNMVNFTLHCFGDYDWPSSLPLDRELSPRQL